MGQLEFTADNLTLISYWQYNSSGKRTMWTEDNQAIVFDVVGIPEGATVRRAVFTCSVSTPATGVTKATIYSKDIRGMISGGSVSMRVNLRSNRQMTIAVSFKATPTSSTQSGTDLKMQRWFLTNIKLTVAYDTDEYTEPPEEPRMVLVPKRTVKLFAPKETVFTGNGLCVLSPLSCVVTEEAGGEYELEMEHPIDEFGKWELLREDYIIEAPIPPTYIPEVHMPPWETWMTNKETDLYTTLPSYTKTKTGVDAVVSNPTQFSWSSSVTYGTGTFVTYPVSSYPKTIYRSIMANNQGHVPGIAGSGFWWSPVGTISGSKKIDSDKPQYNPGVIGQHLAENVLVYKVTDYNSTWMQVRSLQGLTGYVKIEDCTKQEATVELVEPARILYTQLFRIYSVSGEDDTHTITVNARHISYDLQKNVLYDCQLEECEPPTALANLQGSMVNEDETKMQWSNPRYDSNSGEWVVMTEPESRKLLCDMTAPEITVNWSYQNPIQALLDPEEGLAGKAKAKVVRDNQDIFILDNSAPRVGPSITYGVNMRGVTWTRSTEDVITRVIPRAKDKNDQYIYLETLYVDSDAIDEYAVIATEILDSEYKEGQKIKHLDGSETTLSLTDVIERMQSEAEDRFFVDHCDAVSVSLNVEFVLLGDTEEYAQYRNLQRLQIYDRITINTGKSGLKTTAQVSGYEWDCLMGRYNSISIGRVFKQSRRRLPGYRLASGAITYSKLAPDLISYIKGAE